MLAERTCKFEDGRVGRILHAFTEEQISYLEELDGILVQAELGDSKLYIDKWKSSVCGDLYLPHPYFGQKFSLHFYNNERYLDVDIRNWEVFADGIPFLTRVASAISDDWFEDLKQKRHNQMKDEISGLTRPFGGVVRIRKDIVTLKYHLDTLAYLDKVDRQPDSALANASGFLKALNEYRR